jgi:ABC-2 type transport system ATP-binding protein
MEDIERLCKRIVVLREGAVVYDGSLSKVVSDYARYKILTARILNNGATLPSSEDFPEVLGRIVMQNDDYIKVQVLKNRISDGVRHILENYPIMDVNIEEEDIGTIIESIMKRERTSHKD